jgi:hypothetical protein
MMELEAFVYLKRHDTEALCERLLPFLNDKSDHYFYCVQCKVLLSNRNNHHGGSHFKYCTERRPGRSIKHWERNNPGIVPDPVPFHDISIYCDTFQKYYHEISNS